MGHNFEFDFLGSCRFLTSFEVSEGRGKDETSELGDDILRLTKGSGRNAELEMTGAYDCTL